MSDDEDNDRSYRYVIKIDQVYLDVSIHGDGSGPVRRFMWCDDEPTDFPKDKIVVVTSDKAVGRE